MQQMKHWRLQHNVMRMFHVFRCAGDGAVRSYQRAAWRNYRRHNREIF